MATSAKASHYTQAVSAALLSGAWGDNHPVAAYNRSTALDWAEGIRKWGKHTGRGGSGIGCIKQRDDPIHSFDVVDRHDISPSAA